MNTSTNIVVTRGDYFLVILNVERLKIAYYVLRCC